LINYLKKQIIEILKDVHLQYYGFFLGTSHLWTFLYWNRNSFFVTSQSGINAEPLCFPFFPDCDLWRSSISMETWQWILYIYGALGVLSAIFFVTRGLVSLAYFLLALVTLLKFALHMSNYNFMGNYHYMAYFVTMAFLFVGHKKHLIKYLIVSFYIAAGALKMNMDWLSGAAMIRTPWLNGPLLSVSLFYVVLLELVLVAGLLHRRQSVRIFVLIQLLAFHIFSWHIVGFYYPMVMFSLLSLFVMDEWSAWRTSSHSLTLLTDIHQGKARKTHYVALAIFWIFQAIPYALVSDVSLSGAARLSSLNMFDSKTRCHSLLVAHSDQGDIHLDKPMKNLGVRLKCDPIVFLNQAHQLCRLNKESQEINRLSLSLFSRRNTQSKLIKVLEIDNVCALKNPLWAELTEESS
jgi:hypothetical protein